MTTAIVNPRTRDASSTPRTPDENPMAGVDPFGVDDLRGTIATIIDGTNDGILNENANKDRHSIPTRRDLIAGAAVKDYALSRMDPRFAEAHKKGIIHIHDLDYFSGDQINCSIPNVKDMFDNGTAISDKAITTPKSLQTASTLLSQVIAQVASNQYGGTTINNVNELLAPYLRASHEKYKKMLSPIIDDPAKLEAAAKVLSDKELASSIQTISYQISTLSTSNGQTPFVTMSLRTDPNFEYKDESNRIIAEILDQRTRGIPGASGHYETQIFPKLIFVTNEYNVPEDSEFHWLLRKAAKCTASRMYPDYVSEKIMNRDYDGQVFAPMGCRSFLPPYYDNDGKAVVEGRFNKGVATVNIPRAAIEARIKVLGRRQALDPQVLGWDASHGGRKDGNVVLADGSVVSTKEAYDRIREQFWRELDSALELLKGVQLYRVDCLKGTKASSAPMLWQHGALARLNADDVIDPLFYGGYSTLSLGYIGLYEASELATGTSNFGNAVGGGFAMDVVRHLEEKADEWNEELNVGWSVYGTPSESLVGRFAKLIHAEFGDIDGLIDDTKTYLTNSFHVNVTQETDAFSKLAFESQFQPHSKGGTISYVEMGDLRKNIDAILAVITFAYNHILYSEFNGRSENTCLVCGHEGEIRIEQDEEGEWGYQCPKCGNRDNSKIIAVARVCGYLGDNRHGINQFKLQEFKQRVVHI